MGYKANQLPMEEYRTWRLCTLLHCRPSELDGESAITLDWILAVDDVVTQARQEQEQKEINNAR